MCDSSIARRARARSSRSRSSSSTAMPTAPSHDRSRGCASNSDDYPCRRTGEIFSRHYLTRGRSVATRARARRDRPVAAHAASHGRVAGRRVPARGGRRGRSRLRRSSARRGAVAARRSGRHPLRELRRVDVPDQLHRAAHVSRHTRDRAVGAFHQQSRGARADAASVGRREAAVLHCRHRTYGVGMFDTCRVLDADAIVRAGRRSPAHADVPHRHRLALPRRAHAPRHRSVGARRERPGSTRFGEIHGARVLGPPSKRGRNWPRLINTTSSSSARGRRACAPACTPAAPC